MGFVSKIAALAFAATASVAAADLGITKLTKKLSQVDTNGTSCLLLTNCFVR
jgi:hypothetical protein